MAHSNVFFKRRIRPVLQDEVTECGLACLTMLATYHGHECSLNEMRARFGTSLRGAKLSDIVDMADSMGLASRALRLEPEAIQNIKLPCIAHWNMDHFVILEKVIRGQVEIVDPSVGRMRVAAADVANNFTGVCLEVWPDGAFSSKKLEKRLGLLALFKQVRGIEGAFLKLIALSVALQLAALLFPFFSQIVVDNAIISGDYQLINLAGLFFLTLALLEGVSSVLRSYHVVRLGAELRFGWANNFIRHLLKLPLGFFEKRSLGDIISRYRSLYEVQGIATGTIVEGLVDGSMAVTTLVVMFYYSTPLALVAAIFTAILLGVRLAVYPAHRRSAMESLVQNATATAHLLESVRGMTVIKTFGAETTREVEWQRRSGSAVRATSVVEGYDAIRRVMERVINSFELVAVVWIGAREVINHSLSVGMLVAFLGYRALFAIRAAGLVDKLLQLKLVTVHLDRLGDVLLSEPEGGDQRIEPQPAASVFGGAVELRDVSFRYSAMDPELFRNLNFQIRPGECVAVIAPSGVGKTTFLKLLMGLLTPTSGQLLIDGREVNSFGVRNYRSQAAAVMQDDSLLSGTIAQNIALFEEQIDMDRVRSCAEMAGICRDIDAMPMRFGSRIGDMGSALSGGQKQRVLLARALYRNPRILFLDEATSHLDEATEQTVNSTLSTLKITKIIVTHRRSALSLADRVVDLGDLFDN